MLIIIHRMSEPIVEWVGSSCGKHGAYTFYKGFKLTANGETRKYLLGEFYFIRSSKDRPICIAEFQLLWHDANTDNKLASARLYFRPESIPGGRQSCHGKDELLYTDEKVVILCKDMMNLEYDGTGWSYGMKAISELNLQEVPTPGSHESEDTKKFRLLKRTSKSKVKKIMPKERAKIIVLSFPAYCRFKSLMKKLSSGLVLTKMAIKAFGGVIQCNDTTWVSFSRESFHHPGLAKFDMFSHNKAPVLKGRPRKKKTSKSTVSKDEIKVKNSQVVSEQPSNEADSSDDNQTDTSETSSIGGQELPCPPKLVKEEPAIPETSKGVIRTVKQASEYVSKPSAIPPIPKLVKIEPKEANTVPYRHFQHYTEPVVSLMNTNQTSRYNMDKNIPLKMSFSSSVISTSRCGDVGRSRDSGTRVTYTTQSCKVEQGSKISEQETSRTYVHASSHENTSLVSRATTVAPNHNMQPRMSTIVSVPLATKGDVTKNLRTCGLSRPGNDAKAEQPLKRKRGRPPGKSNKFLKLSEVKIAPRKETSLVEVNGVDDQIHMEIETGEHMYPESGVLLENEEDSPEPQNAEERELMKNLKIFMQKRGSPIEKVPALGFRKINLFKMYEVTQALGGYDQVTSKKLWRRVYKEVGGAPSITSAATNTRKHYEKLLLPYERYLKGEKNLLDIKPLGSPPKPDGRVSPQRDQNGNVVSQYNSVVLSTSQQDKPTVSNVTSVTVQPKPSVPTHVQPSSQQENSFTPIVSLVSRQKQLFKSAVSRETSLSQQNNRSNPAVTRVVSSSQQGRHAKPSVSYITSMSSQNKPSITTVLPMSQPDKTFHQAVAQTIEQTHYAKSTVSGDSYQCQQDRRSVVSHLNTHYQCNKQANQATDTNSAVEFVTTGSRSSPNMQYSSNVDKLSAKYPTNIPFEQQSIRRDARPGVITGTGTSECVVATKPKSLRSEKKAYITEFSEDCTGMYVAQNKVRNEPRTSIPEFENRPEYVPRYDHVNNLRRKRDFHSSEHVSEESRAVRKHARGTGDEILLTNVVPSKMSRAHSPLPRDEGFMFSVPVFQPTHYPHGGFELYDLPSTTFPVRASSRIFMPSHQIFPGTRHPAFSPYSPHIIATIGTDPGALYQLPIPGYYPQDIGYPMDTGVQILHS